VTNQPQALINALLIKNTDEAGRDDAARNLGAYDEPEVEEALVTVASDPETEPMVARSCGESLAEIWIRQHRLPEEVLPRLRPEALAELAGYINWYGMKDQQEKVRSAVRKVLWEQWDPIGVNDSPAHLGEYDGYANTVCALLRRGADNTEICDYLRQVEIKNMGLSGSSRDHFEVVVGALRAIEQEPIENGSLAM
jgi:hypothetical protein